MVKRESDYVNPRLRYAIDNRNKFRHSDCGGVFSLEEADIRTLRYTDTEFTVRCVKCNETVTWNFPLTSEEETAKIAAIKKRNQRLYIFAYSLLTTIIVAALILGYGF